MNNYIKRFEAIKGNQDGFSLIELVIAVAIMAVLSVLGVVAYSGATNNARKAAVESAASSVYTGAVAYDKDDKTETQPVNAADEFNKSAKADTVITTVSMVEDEVCVRAEYVANDGSYKPVVYRGGVGCGDTGSGASDGGGTGTDGGTTPGSTDTDTDTITRTTAHFNSAFVLTPGDWGSDPAEVHIVISDDNGTVFKDYTGTATPGEEYILDWYDENFVLGSNKNYTVDCEVNGKQIITGVEVYKENWRSEDGSYIDLDPGVAILNPNGSAFFEYSSDNEVEAPAEGEKMFAPRASITIDEPAWSGTNVSIVVKDSNTGDVIQSEDTDDYQGYAHMNFLVLDYVPMSKASSWIVPTYTVEAYVDGVLVNSYTIKAVDYYVEDSTNRQDLDAGEIKINQEGVVRTPYNG